MNQNKALLKEAMKVLKATSRTFYIPITFLEKELKTTVAMAYLCMRAIDEIEDHENLSNDVKNDLLLHISELLKSDFNEAEYQALVQPYQDILPEVTLRLGDWISLIPNSIVQKVNASTSEMAEGMAKWASKDWVIHTKEDLDEYTYYVAGLVGVMLSDLWKWHADIDTDRELAIGYGRGLQAVNILRNQDEDDERGVSFMPDGWTRDDLFQYAESNLAKADLYMKSIRGRGITLFCKIPLELAYSTLKALKNGKEKITRQEVEQIVETVTAE